MDSVLDVLLREVEETREIISGRRTGISTVLGFNGVLIGLSLFGVGDVTSGEGVLARSDLLEPFGWLAGVALVLLAAAALTLLVALRLEKHALLNRTALDKLQQAAAGIDGGGAVRPAGIIKAQVDLLACRDGILDKLRAANAEQLRIVRLGLTGTALGFALLTGAGLIVVAEVLSR